MNKPWKCLFQCDAVMASTRMKTKLIRLRRP